MTRRLTSRTVDRRLAVAALEASYGPGGAFAPDRLPPSHEAVVDVPTPSTGPPPGIPGDRWATASWHARQTYLGTLTRQEIHP